MTERLYLEKKFYSIYLHIKNLNYIKMPEFSRTLDVYQGFNFNKDKNTPIGFITKISISNVSLNPDIEILNSQNEAINVIAVLNDVSWQIGVTDTIYFSGQVSAHNKQIILSLVMLSLTSDEVNFEFEVFDYDPLSKKYYLNFHSNKTTLNGFLEKRGNDFNLSVADEPSSEIQTPQNYTFSMGIKPQEQAQILHIASDNQKNIVKSWGLAVG